MSHTITDSNMVTIKTSNKDIEVFVTIQHSGDITKIAICLKKVPEGNMKIVHTISDEDVESFLEGLK